MAIKPDDFHYQTGKKKEFNSYVGNTEDSVNKNKSGNSFLSKFFLFIFLIGSIVFLILWLSVTDTNKSLERRLKHNLDLYGKEIQNKEELQDKYDRLKNNIANTILSVGHEGAYPGGYDTSYKVFFYVYKRLLLRSVYVKANGYGSIRIMLCDMSNNIIQKSDSTGLSYPNNWQKVMLNFKINPGRYYLKFEGDTGLSYHSENLLYPYKIGNLIEITGSDNADNYSRTSYYQYFYAREISLLFD